MSRTEEKITVVISVSSHNSEQDDIDRAAVARLRELIEQSIAADPVLNKIAWLV